METSLHRQLKQQYAGGDGQTEVVCDGYRIDAIDGDELIEIQQASLASIRDKIARLLKSHRVRVVKPIVLRKQLVKCRNRAGKEVARRMSPKQGTLVDLVHELVYVTRVFPHERVRLEVPLVTIEEALSARAANVVAVARTTSCSIASCSTSSTCITFRRRRTCAA
ncbi:MAG: hypothetical protein R3C10_20005 [Pirellulales bacterium]